MNQLVFATELDLLHTQSMQRLYDLHQLGLTDRVFIDASHSRLHHVVGVLHQVDSLVKAIAKNLRKGPQGTFSFGEDRMAVLSALDLAKLVEKSRPTIRLIGLLHDLTHAPYGHTVEDEIELVACKHDDPKRQAEAYYRLLCEYVGWLAKDAPPIKDLLIPDDLAAFLNDPDEVSPPNPEKVGSFLAALISGVPAESLALSWRVPAHEVAEFIGQLRVAMTALLHLELLHKDEPTDKHFPQADGTYSFQRLCDSCLNALGKAPGSFSPHRDAYMLDVVGNTVCADLLDYAKRDSRHANLKLDYDAERIAEHFTLVECNENFNLLPQRKNRQNNTTHVDPFEGWCIRTAISLFSHKFRAEVPSELMNLLNVRFFLYERAIYNPTKCAAGAMLGTALQLLGWRRAEGEDDGDDILPRRLRNIGDAVFLHDIGNAVRIILNRGMSPLPSSESNFMGSQIPIARCLEATPNASQETVDLERSAGLELLRRLRARRFYRPVFRVLPSLQESKLKVKPADVAAKLRHSDIRYRVERQIEVAAGLRLGSIVIHCPRENTAEKVANALLVMPDADVEKAKICRLHDITELSPELFSTHEKAVHAVEAMYKSMWRLVVYVSPEYLPRYEEIIAKAGEVLFQAVGSKDARKMYPSAALSNDPMLQLELEKRRDAATALRQAQEHAEAPATVDSGSVPVETVLGKLLSDSGLAPKSGGEFDQASLEDFVRRAAARFREDEIIGEVFKDSASSEERSTVIQWISAHPMGSDRYTRFKEHISFKVTWPRKGSASERLKRVMAFLDQAYEQSNTLFKP
jgi:HD superfamily phosphohydrolase